VEDHWNEGELLHSIPHLVLRRANFFPDGRIDLVTTARVFGQVMNPISLYSKVLFVFSKLLLKVVYFVQFVGANPELFLLRLFSRCKIILGEKFIAM
jgi:hypothetical protein